MKTVFRLELKSMLSGIRAYVYTAITLFISALFVARYNLEGGLPNLEYSLELTTIPMLLILPILVSDIFSGSSVRGFDAMLLSFGVREHSLLFGKLLARLSVFAPNFILISVMPLVLCIFGTVNLAEAYAGLLGYLLFCLAVISVYVFVSSLIRSAVISTIVCYTVSIAMYVFELLYAYLPRSVNASFFTLTVIVFALAFIVYLITDSEIFSVSLATVIEALLLVFRFAFVSSFHNALPLVMKVLSPRSSLTGFFYGILDIGEILYLICFIAIFTVSSLISLEMRKYTGKER